MTSYCLGMATVLEIAKKAGLKRTTIYPIIDNLKKKGLLFKAKRGKRSYLYARTPESLLDILEETKVEFSKMLPQIRKARMQSVIKPEVTFYESRVGFKKVWEEIFNSRKLEFLIITSARDFENFISKSYLRKSIIQKKLELGIKSRQIITNSALARKIVARDSQENRLSKVAPANFPFIATEVIFGDNVAIISTKFENLIMIIKSEVIAKTHRSYFELIWKTL